MRQPKGKPQGFTTALSVCVMVSTNCTWKAERASDKDRPCGRWVPAGEDRPCAGWVPVVYAWLLSPAIFFLQKQIKKNTSTAHCPAQKFHLKLSKYINMSIFPWKSSS